ncbi:nucleotidyltransferase family protein [uncultured Thomasclavelia sp.]|uniref:nucleotidyltransferase domain-containing protein n=1 Tax=uncultured Thomasclavelia sp. TaxID=3025759 RepID=UPI002639E882|nr:nucleotidyltransferase family protein [uncultured Thomasclavelia sp.]
MNSEMITLLKDARLNRISKPIRLDYSKLYELSNQHQISALIFNQIYSFDDFPLEIKQRWKSDALKINAFQTRKTMKILHLCKQFSKQNLRVLIVKGLICRALYPQPDNRQSNDEDLYVQKEEYEAVKDILLKNNFTVVSDSDDVTTFIDPVSGLSIELHTALFSLESKAYGNYQRYFDQAFDKCIVHRIDGVEVYSLEYTQHLLFLILHFVKHFFHGGVGIRQVVDIVMYSEAYGDKVNWDRLYDILKDLNIYVLITSLFAMAHDRLEFDYTKIRVPEGIDKSDYQDLFEDIMDAGIFGQSSPERIHSATITLNTISDGKTSVLKSIFPSLKEMQGKYKYLNKYPVLLPFAYFSRIVNYKKNNSSKNSQRTIEVGKQRIELLKKYRVIK